MTIFQIKENGYNEIRNYILKWTIPVVLFSVAVGVFISEYSFSGKAFSSSTELPFVIVILLGTVAFGITKSIKRQKIIFETYQLKMDDKCIIREQNNTPAINMLYSDIKTITKTSRGGLLIKGDSSLNMIHVPAQINNMEGVVDLLKSNCNIDISAAKPASQKYLIPLIIFILGSLVTLYVSKNKILVLISGVIILSFSILSFISIQKNKNIDNKTRRSSYWMIFLVLAVIIIMISKLVIA